MVVDAEQHVDVGVRLKGVEAGAERGVEEAAAVDAPMPHVAAEALGEALDEAVAAGAGVGQRLERDDEDAGCVDAPGKMPRRFDAEIVAGGVVVGAQIGAARLRGGLGEEGNAPALRHQTQRLGPLALERRQHDRIGVVDGQANVLGRCRRDIDPDRGAGRAETGHAAMGPAERAIRRQPRDVAPDRHLRHPAEPRGEVVDRGDADLAQDREYARFTLGFDHF